MADALGRGDLDAIDGALDEEWSNRRQLADGITTPEIESIIARAKALGAGSAKICGAGGGGCVVLCVPRGRRPSIEAALSADGVRVIDYTIARRGLELGVSD
jgi:D-glycero-alpha-D-manno-heptose-7-phosphate kinase